MTIFSPESDSVVLREHIFYDTGVDSWVVAKDLKEDTGFVPVEEQGLGIFSYIFAGSEGSYPGDNRESTDEDSLPLPNSQTIIIFISSICLTFIFAKFIRRVVLSRLHNWFYSTSTTTISNSKTFNSPIAYRKLRTPNKRRRQNSQYSTSKRNLQQRFNYSPVAMSPAETIISYSFQSPADQSNQSPNSQYHYHPQKLPTPTSNPLINSPKVLPAHYYNFSDSVQKTESKNQQPRFSPVYALPLKPLVKPIGENPFVLNGTPASSVSSADSVFSPYNHVISNASNENMMNISGESSPDIEKDPEYIKMTKVVPRIDTSF